MSRRRQFHPFLLGNRYETSAHVLNLFLTLDGRCPMFIPRFQCFPSALPHITLFHAQLGTVTLPVH